MHNYCKAAKASPMRAQALSIFSMLLAKEKRTQLGSPNASPITEDTCAVFNKYMLKSAAFFIPIIGNIIAAIIGAGISYGTTYLSLNSILDAFEKALLDIMEYCFRNRCLEIQTD